MSLDKELLMAGADGTLSFGDYTLAKKTKIEDFQHQGDLYKVKTYDEITKLEKNGMFVYESVPGTRVEDFRSDVNNVSFTVLGAKDAQLTLELEADSEYVVYVDEAEIGDMTTNLSGKLVIGVELDAEHSVAVKIRKK